MIYKGFTITPKTISFGNWDDKVQAIVVTDERIVYRITDTRSEHEYALKRTLESAQKMIDANSKHWHSD